MGTSVRNGGILVQARTRLLYGNAFRVETPFGAEDSLLTEEASRWTSPAYGGVLPTGSDCRTTQNRWTRPRNGCCFLGLQHTAQGTP